MRYFADKFEQIYRIKEGREWYLERYNPLTNIWEATNIVASPDDDTIPNELRSITEAHAEYTIDVRYKD